MRISIHIRDLILVIVVIVSVGVRCYLKRPYVAIVDDIEVSDRSDSDGKTWESVAISYSSSGNKYGKISLPKKTFDKHLPDLKVGDRILKYRGNAVPRLLRNVDTKAA
jgi:hypothetical protein